MYLPDGAIEFQAPYKLSQRVDVPLRLEHQAYAGLASWEVCVKPKLPDDGQVHDGRLTKSASAQERATLSWPWGLVAIGVMALAWVGIYLVWNGLAFLLNW